MAEPSPDRGRGCVRDATGTECIPRPSPFRRVIRDPRFFPGACGVTVSFKTMHGYSAVRGPQPRDLSELAAHTARSVCSRVRRTDIDMPGARRNRKPERPEGPAPRDTDSRHGPRHERVRPGPGAARPNAQGANVPRSRSSCGRPAPGPGRRARTPQPPPVRPGLELEASARDRYGTTLLR